MFFAALGKELKEQWRSYRLLVVVAVLAIFGMLSPVIAYYTPEIIQMVPGGEAFAGIIPAPGVADAVAQYVKNVGQFGVLLALLVPMGAVVQEKERGTAAMLLSKPLPRGTFLLAKHAAVALVFGAALLISGLAGYAYTLALFGPLDFGGWMLMNGLLWAYLLMYACITLFFSTIGRSQLAAAGLSLGVLIALGLAGITPVIAQHLPAELFAWAARAALGQAGDAPVALGVSLGLIVLTTLGAWLAFRRQEL